MSAAAPVFINRELSWLSFNERVLFEAEDTDNPVLERLKFLSIVGSNFEEFFMIRVAVLKKQLEAKLTDRTLDTMTPEEQLAAIRARVLRMLEKQYALFTKKIVPELGKNGIRILIKPEEAENYREALEEIFENRVKPLLTPISVGPSHPFPTLVTGRLYLAVGLGSSANEGLMEKSALSFVEIPVKVTGRFIRVGGEADGAYVPVENIIRLFIDRIYRGYDVLSSGIILIMRDADFSLQEDGASDLLSEIESTIKTMHRRSVIKIEYEKGLSPDILNVIVEKSRIGQDDLYEINGILKLQDLMTFYDTAGRDDLKFEQVNPVYPEGFRNRDIFKAVNNGDQLLFHPYHSYDPLVELLNRAAEDPDVLAIKQTLYRTSSHSSIISALVKAAENGKYVTVIDELRARFDEKRNIEWARKLEDAGAHVIYGVKGLKTHAKALLIVKKDPETGSIRRYVHLGTGNYNETTAKLYTDFSYFTAEERMGEDISSLFNLLTGFSYDEQWNMITIAPLGLRMKFIALIRREQENAKKGIKASITAKMNSLSDPEIIRELYAASGAGVKIRLIVRGICCLVPGVKGLSENIGVVSLIGRYLEHSRIYVFHNAGDPEYYLSSADWMNRNMDRRVELLFPVTGEDDRSFIAKVLELQFEDSENSWKLGPDGNYEPTGGKTAKKKDSFSEIYRYVRKIEETKKGKSPIRFEPNKGEEP